MDLGACFEDELTCPVCLMLFTDPRTLPCGNSHNVCVECARGLWRNQTPSAYGSTIQCPVCRQSCSIGGGVEKLPLNLALKNMVEKLESVQKGKPTKKSATKKRFRCDVCENKVAVMECVTCVVKYCQGCLETCHPKERAVFKAHVVSPIEPITSRECETHEDQALAFFCTQCGVPVCAHCLLMGAHIEHPRVSLHSAVQERKEALLETIEALKVKRAVVLDFTNKADLAMETMRSQCNEMRGRVEAECRELQMLTQDLEKKLIDVIDAQEKEKGAELMQHVEGQRHKLTVWGGMLDRADLVVTDEDGAVFLDVNTFKLEKQMRGAVDATTATPALSFSGPTLTLNMAPLREAVSIMHFTELLVPPPPTDLASPESDLSSLLLTWKCDTRKDRPNTFIVQQAPFGDGHETIEWVEVYKGSARAAKVSDLSPQTSYRFRVCAQNSSGKGAWSDEAVLTTGVPKAPQDLVVLATTGSSLQLAWVGEPSLRSRHCSYVLEMCCTEPPADAQGGDWEPVYTGPARTCRVKGLKPERSYWFRAFATNSAGKGPESGVWQFSTTQVSDENDTTQIFAEEAEGNGNSNFDTSVAEPAMNAPTTEPESMMENAVASSSVLGGDASP
mmetsp:Transcript_18956/g.46554  ORF Transcript_18956/g.46554 Transcript_18956/m.46554 type:complete len:618 (-) Transcript_18956:9-1862(-)